MASRGLKRKLSDMTTHECIHFRAVNPHKEGNAPYHRYEAYKEARNLKQFYTLNQSAKLRCKDWQYALDHACVTRRGPATLNISIYDRGGLVDKASWLCDNRMSQAALISMLRHDFGFKRTIAVFAATNYVDINYADSLVPSEQPLASIGIGAFQPEAFVHVVYTQGRQTDRAAEVDRAADELESRRKDVCDLAEQLERAQEREAAASQALVHLLPRKVPLRLATTRSKFKTVKEGDKDDGEKEAAARTKKTTKARTQGAGCE